VVQQVDNVNKVVERCVPFAYDGANFGTLSTIFHAQMLIYY